MAVLIDRSKDPFHGGQMGCLTPNGVFLTTENHGRMSNRLLSKYDVLVLYGNSTERYTEGELAAVKAFVARGGGLLIVASSGWFEWVAGRPVGDMTANEVAKLFGFRFLSAGDLPPDVEAVRCHERARLELTSAGEKLGLRLGEIPLDHPGPISTPKGATALMREKATRQPVFAVSRYGRGRVLVCNDTRIGNDWTQWSEQHWLMAVAPKSRIDRKPNADVVDPRSLQETKQGRIVVRHTAAMKRDAAHVAGLARQVFDQLSSLLRPNKKIRRWQIELRPGCGEDMGNVEDMGNGGRDGLRSAIGRGLSDGAVVGILAKHLGSHFVNPRNLRGIHPYLQQSWFYLEIIVLERLGFSERARELRRALEGGPAVDLVRFYCGESWENSPRYRRLWLDIAGEFGDDALRRFLKSVPDRDAGKGIERAVFDGFEILAFYLATALGESAYDWLENQGHSIRRIPLEKPGSDELSRAMMDFHKKTLSDSNQLASERFDALSVLAVRLGDEKVSLASCTRKAKSRRAAESLPATARLLSMRDRRGAQLVRPWLNCPDQGLAAAAALLLTFEAQDAEAADVLAGLASEQDTRFQLSAGHALKLARHPEAERFAFSKVKGCRLKIVEDGEVKIFAVVDGYEVANVFNLPTFIPEPFGRAHSDYYVGWVHTDGRWRRRGLARMCMERSLEHRWDQLCATTSLHTGTRNVAHTLYRDFGLIDYQKGITFAKALRPEPPVKPPQGIRIRRARKEDTAKAAELLNTHFEAEPSERYRLTRWPDGKVAWVACKGNRIMGVATATVSGNRASLEHIAVAEVQDRKGKPVGKHRALLGHALLNAVHRGSLKKKATSIQAGSWSMPITDGIGWALRRQGYGSKLDGGVWMRRINNLAQYLDEIAPVLRRRLADSKTWADWEGTIVIEGSALSAVLKIDRGNVEVMPHMKQTAMKAQDEPSITIRAGDLAIQRIAFGIEHPFEEYLQSNATVTPHLNDRARNLLETLFPKSVRES